MPDVTLAKATIAAALIQSGQFTFPPLEPVADGTSFEWRDAPTYVALRRLTDAIYASLQESTDKPVDIRDTLGVSK